MKKLLKELDSSVILEATPEKEVSSGGKGEHAESDLKQDETELNQSINEQFQSENQQNSIGKEPNQSDAVDFQQRFAQEFEELTQQKFLNQKEDKEVFGNI